MTQLIFPDYTGTIFTTDLTNDLILATYIGQVWIGTPLQPLMVVWDTGSERLLVKSSECSKCSETKFVAADSTSFSLSSPLKWYDEEYMDGTYLKGKIASDRVCPSSDTAGCS